MQFVVILVLLVIFLIVYAFIGSRRRTATIKINDGNRTLVSATGNSVDDAFCKMFDKLYEQAENAVKSETIQRRIDEMETAFSQSQGKLSRKTNEYCAILLSKAKARKRSVQDEEVRRKQEAARKKQEAIKTAAEARAAREDVQQLREAKREAEQATREAKAEKAKYEQKNAALKAQRTKKKIKPEDMTPHQRFMYEQRRLMTDSLRYDVMKRDGFRCVLCGATTKEDNVKLHVDHIIPIAKGGKTELSNLRPLCERCNLGKRDKIEADPAEQEE